jgi:sugar phosphate isomerase/epimerase
VLHGWSGFDYTFREDTLYFDNFEQIVHHAKCKGICIAFENLEGEEFLVALMKHFRDHDNVGYCWDSGHAHCYPHKTDFLAEFGDRLVMTHLNDNLGTRDPNGIPSGVDDLHFLPLDGTIDWTGKLQQLRASRKLETLNFELKVTSHSKAPEDRIYENIPLPAYLAEAANRAKRIAEAYSKL